VIKAIIFDFGGVIGTDGYWAWLQKQVPNFAERELFFHDRQGHVDAANTFGLQAFVYTTNEKLTQDLRAHGITV